MGTILTSEAQCRDCYKCIRYCPVKAIGLKEGQAWVVEEKCIWCGQCIVVCPQQAKGRSRRAFGGKILGRGARVVCLSGPFLSGDRFYFNPMETGGRFKNNGCVPGGGDHPGGKTGGGGVWSTIPGAKAANSHYRVVVR